MKPEDLLANLNNLPSLATEEFSAVAPSLGQLGVVFRSLTAEEREEVTAGLERQTRGTLLAIGRSAATAAVRLSSAELVRAGLLALTIEGGRLDVRDSQMAMALLFHSGRKLGMGVERAFAEASDCVTDPKFASTLRGFPLREPRLRDLSAFLFRERMAQDGFAYEQVQPRASLMFKLEMRIRKLFGWVR